MSLVLSKEKLKDLFKPDIKFKPKLSLKTFIYKDVIIDNSVTGLTTTGQQAADPSIVYDDNNKRYLVYFFANVSNHSETYVCESNDLLNMKFIGKVLPVGPSGSFDENHAEKACVKKIDNIYYMFYSGKNYAGNSKIGLATSTDGVNFVKYDGNPILEDPEGTNYLDSPTVFKWKDGNYYMFAYNGNGKNILFKATNFPYTWQMIGKLENRFFSILSTDAIYDDELDKILLFANIFYPKPSGISEPARTGHLALFYGDEPSKLTYGGILLTSLPRDTRSYPLRYFQQNVYAPSVIKVDSGKYVILINGTEDGTESSERIFRIDLGVGEEQTLHIINTYSTTTSDEKFAVIRLPPGLRLKLKHAMLYAYAGTPTELYIFDGKPEAGKDDIIVWTNTNRLEYIGNPITVNGEYLGVAIKGASGIGIAYSFLITLEPSVNELRWFE